MKVVVLGSGVIGVTTAYVLASRGHEVTVIDRKNECGAETSFANGGQLSYSYGEPWPTPGVLKKLPKWLLDPNSPLIFRLRWDPDMFRWGLQFLAHCTTARAERGTVNLLRLGLYSRLKMQELVAEAQVDFDYAETGILQVFKTEKDFKAALEQASFQAKFGVEQKVLTREEVLESEPALTPAGSDITGGLLSPQDAIGDAYKFCVELMKRGSAKFGVKYHCDTDIRSIVAEDGRIVSVTTDKGEHTADAYVMALGSYTPLFLQGLGIRIPVYPMKGYSFTIAGSHGLKKSVMDNTHKIVFTPLGDRLRVAGTAELAGYNDMVLEQRMKPMVKASKALFPNINWDNRTHEWACLRAATPSCMPILGATPLENLFLNTGHGTLGWTQAAGCAAIVADVMEKRTPGITLDGLTMEAA